MVISLGIIRLNWHLLAKSSLDFQQDTVHSAIGKCLGNIHMYWTFQLGLLACFAELQKTITDQKDMLPFISKPFKPNPHIFWYLQFTTQSKPDYPWTWLPLVWLWCEQKNWWDILFITIRSIFQDLKWKICLLRAKNRFHIT